MQLQGKTAIVTGASTGMGRAIAQAIAAEGARVGLVARNFDGLAQTEQLIRDGGGEARVFPADLRDEQALVRLAGEVERAWGGADIVVNVAGVWHSGEVIYAGRELADTPPEQINEILDVVVRAPLLLTRLFLPHMIEQRAGKVINISGTFEHGAGGWVHNYTAKKALEDFTVGLAQELRRHEIQVNCISPSDTSTDALRHFFPEEARTALNPATVARLAIFLLADEVAEHITGQVIVIKNKSAY